MNTDVFRFNHNKHCWHGFNQSTRLNACNHIAVSDLCAAQATQSSVFICVHLWTETGLNGCAVSSSEQHQVIAVDQFGLVDVAQRGFDLVRGLAHDFPGFIGGVIDQSAGDFAAIG